MEGWKEAPENFLRRLADFAPRGRRFPPCPVNRKAGYSFRERLCKLQEEKGKKRKRRRRKRRRKRGRRWQKERRKGLSTFPLLYTVQRAYILDKSTKVVVLSFLSPCLSFSLTLFLSIGERCTILNCNVIQCAERIKS